MEKVIVQVLHEGDDEATWEYLDKLTDPEEIVTRDESQATLEDLVLLCDRHAENVNAGDFVGIHRLLGALLYRQYGRANATETMFKIAKFGGLHGMGGVCADDDAYALLGVGNAGCDWAGSYGD